MKWGVLLQEYVSLVKGALRSDKKVCLTSGNRSTVIFFMSDRPLRPGKVTQKDIAKALNLSRASVAFALNPKLAHKLPVETVALIQQKAEELDYRPQELARILRRGRSHTVALLFVSSNFQPGQERVKELARQTIAAGYQMVAVDLAWFNDDERAAQDYLLKASVEGVVFYNLPTTSEVAWSEFLHRRGIRVLSFHKTDVAIDQAYSDMEASFRALTLHHLEQGARAPLLLLPGRRSASQEVAGQTMLLRVEGFLKALEDVGGALDVSGLGDEVRRYLGLDQRPSLPRGTPGGVVGYIFSSLEPSRGSDVFEQGAVYTAGLLEKAVAFDALLCSNDSVAAGALSALHDAGVAVPREVTLSGADNAAFSRFCGVPLTTVQQVSSSLVEWGIKRLVRQIECDGTLPLEARAFPCEVVVRRSTMR